MCIYEIEERVKINNLTFYVKKKEYGKKKIIVKTKTIMNEKFKIMQNGENNEVNS